MENFVPVITLKELKKALEKLEKDYELDPDTKVFLDTGWDSLQEVAPDALSVEEARSFSIEDVLSHEEFGGFSLMEKAERMNADGEPEQVLIIRHLY